MAFFFLIVGLVTEREQGSSGEVRREGKSVGAIPEYPVGGFCGFCFSHVRAPAKMPPLRTDDALGAQHASVRWASGTTEF